MCSRFHAPLQDAHTRKDNAVEKLRQITNIDSFHVELAEDSDAACPIKPITGRVHIHIERFCGLYIDKPHAYYVSQA